MARREDWGNGGSGERIGVAEVSKKPFVRGSVGLYFRQGYSAEESDSQFFMLKTASPNLDGKYTGIGRVTKGMNVVDQIQLADVLTVCYVKGEAGK